MAATLNTLQTLIDRLPEAGDDPAICAFRTNRQLRWSYAELGDHVNRLATGLVAAGIGQGDPVALMAGNGPEWVAAALAVVGAGALLVPLDPQMTDAVLEHVLGDSAARWLFTTAVQASRLEQAAMGAGCKLVLLDVGADDDRSWYRLASRSSRRYPHSAPDDDALLFYTSGTTGPPKGVPLTHRNLVFELNRLLTTDLAVQDNRVLLPLPLHHVFPFVVGMLAGLASGSLLVFPESLTGPQIVRALKEGSIITVIGVPRLYSALYSGIQSRAKASGRVGAAAFRAVLGLSVSLRRRFGLAPGRVLLGRVHREIAPNLRILASGGAPLDVDLAWALEGLGWRVFNGYGLTETAPIISVNTLAHTRIGSAGQPLPEVEVVIERCERGADWGAVSDRRTRAPCLEGEILVRGPNVFSGYRHLPEETKRAFTDDGWFRTGDLGWFDRDGYLYISGRVSTVIVTESGENIQPDMVEAAYQVHPLIREIGVLEYNHRLAAVIVPEIGEIRRRGIDDIGSALHDAVRECGSALPTYQRITDYVITREALARTGLGKIRRHLLRERFRQGKRSIAAAQAPSVRPMELREMTPEDRSLLENPVASAAWTWLASRFPDRRLTPDTSPQLDLGIDSLEWLNVSLELRRQTGAELTEAAIRRIDTIRDLLIEVSSAGHGATPDQELFGNPGAVLDDRQLRWLAQPGPIRALLAGAMFALGRTIARCLFRLQVSGAETIPAQGPVIFAPNHLSFLDPLVLAGALGTEQLKHTVWATSAEVIASNPLVGVIARIARVIPIDPGGGGVSSLALGAAVLKEGSNLIWFPEGRRSVSGDLQPFRPGLGVLLQQSDVPVIPVMIRGTFEAMPPGRVVPHPRPVRVIFGRPVYADALEAEGAGDGPAERIAAALHDRVAALGRD